MIARSWLAILSLVVLQPAFSAAAAPAPSKPPSVVDSVCDNPPCTKEELQRAELRLIKRLQRANMLSAEADYRGEKDTAARLHRVFQRNFDRRRTIRTAIDSAAY